MPPLTPSPTPLEQDLLVNRDVLPWVVQKFGGTTVGKFSETIVEKVAKYIYAYIIYMWYIYDQSLVKKK